MEVVLPKPGTYVLAVSGGVDSVTLLHRLALLKDQTPAYKFTVAHFDHGIREDSRQDRLFVQDLARRYGLPFAYDGGLLGPGASEAVARKARYKFLHNVRQASKAQAIITAHHQDDVLETAIINILRGSGRKGLTSLGSRATIERPLLLVAKADIINYARDQGLQWHEDSTNRNQTYLRNYVRHRILNRFSREDRNRLLEIIRKLQNTNRELDTLLVNQLHNQSVSGTIDSQWFNRLDHQVAREIMAAWLRAHEVREFDSKTLERLVVSAKIARPDQEIDVLKGRRLRVAENKLALTMPER